MKTAAPVIPYEQRLDADPEWALREEITHFEEKSDAQTTLRNITRRLGELEIPYVVADGMALFRHGFRRFTEDVDLLVTREGLKAIHEALEGLGYLHVFKGSTKLRDTDTGVTIDFLIAGDYPGDGKPKPVAFPDPQTVGVEMDGLRVTALPRLVELELASGMTNPQRMKDLTDVLELIKAFSLPVEFDGQLSEYVREKFVALWNVAQIPDPFEH